MKNSILITGVAGLIGSRMADWIIENHPEYEVVGIDNLFGGYMENVNEKVIFYKRELGEDDISDIFEKHNFKYVYHFAAYAAEGLSYFMPVFNDKNNMLSTDNIIKECIKHNVERLIYTSSMSVYGFGENEGIPFKEEDKPNPIDPYGVSKFACERNIQILGEHFGLDWCIIRPHNCYSDDTEILTENGWKLFKDLEKDEKVLTLNPATMEVEYNIPDEYHKYMVDDDLYHFTTKGIDLLVTGDHNMVTRTNKKGKIQKITAEEIFADPKKYYYYETLKNDGKFNCIKNEKIIIPEVVDTLNRNMDNKHQNGGEKIIEPEDWFKFIGWFISEGSAYKTKSNYVVSINQNGNVNPKNVEEIKECIKNIGFNFYKNGDNININSKQLYTYIKQLFPVNGCIGKHIPREYLSYNADCLMNLFDSLMKGDGNKDGSRYTTVSKQLADDFTELLLKLGMCGTVDKEVYKGSEIYRVRICKNLNPSFGDMYSKKINCSKVHYEGYVYDVTVKNHIIYVRRNGKSCWGSNCYGVNQNIWDKYRNVLGIWMYQILNNEPILIYGDGEQTRAFSYIDDCLECFWNAAIKPEASKEIINLGGEVAYSINDAAKILCEITGYDKIEHKEPRYEVKHATTTCDKSKEILGYKQTTPLREGLEKMWEWAKRQPKRKRYKWENYEIEKGIYSFWK